jgi:hypothetical protein
MAPGQAHRALVAVDVEKPGDLSKIDDIRPTAGSALESLLREAVDGAAIGWSRCRWLTRRSGGVLIAPGDVESRVVDPLVGHLAAGLRRHNQRGGTPARLRLRMAAHAGTVHEDPDGVTGAAMIHLARLLTAPPLRKHLALTSADLAMLVSDSLHDQIVRHHYSLLDPAAFHPVDVRGAASSSPAWLLASAENPVPVEIDGELRSYRGRGRRLWYEQAGSG